LDRVTNHNDWLQALRHWDWPVLAEVKSRTNIQVGWVKKENYKSSFMKLYFREDDEEVCYTKKQIIEDMKEDGINELKIIEAKRMTGEPYFWCTFFQKPGEVGQTCGRFCPEYKPRNGKNGRCRYSGHCYEPTDKVITLTCR